MRQLSILWAVFVMVGCGGGQVAELQQAQSAAEPKPAQAQSLPQSATSRTFNGTEYIDTDPNDIPAQVFRLYSAAFSRASDASGLGYHVGHIEKLGHSLHQIAANFVGSPEFSSRYGSLTHAQFVTQLYANVLGRSPDAQGLQFHQDNLESGRQSRGQVLVGFSESPENKTKTAAAVAAGIRFKSWLPPTAAGTIPVLRSSYENKAAAGAAMGPQTMPAGSNNGYAFADFFQDGSYSMVSHSLIYSKTRDPSLFGSISFYRKEGGQWVDRTAALLSDTKGCLHARKAVVADFNGDNRPDVFFACHGFDFAPFGGEQQRVLLSQPNGTYQNVVVPVTCFCHAASAADFDGDGFADVVVTDNMFKYRPFFLKNNRNGTFSEDLTRLPGVSNPETDPDALHTKSIFTAELIDFRRSGKYDLFLAGSEPGANGPATRHDFVPQILTNDGSNKFIGTARQRLPVNTTYGMALDIVYIGDKIYLSRTGIQLPSRYYTEGVIEEVDYPAMTGKVTYHHAGVYPKQVSMLQWINWLIPFQGRAVAMDAAFN